MSTALDLSSYSKIQQALFIRMEVPTYGVLRFSNYDVAFNITEEDAVSYQYLPLGILLGVSEFNNELQTSNSEITISLSAIDQGFVAAMMNYALKGSRVTIRRTFFNSDTGVALNIAGNPSVRFTGFISNYSFTDDFNQFSNESTTTVTISCSSIVKILEQKIAGQRTNDSDRKYFYPNDTGFDRVATIVTSNFDFGKKLNA
jgi:hypothetical protein